MRVTGLLSGSKLGAEDLERPGSACAVPPVDLQEVVTRVECDVEKALARLVPDGTASEDFAPRTARSVAQDHQRIVVAPEKVEYHTATFGEREREQLIRGAADRLSSVVTTCLEVGNGVLRVACETTANLGNFEGFRAIVGTVYENGLARGTNERGQRSRISSRGFDYRSHAAGADSARDRAYRPIVRAPTRKAVVLGRTGRFGNQHGA